MTAIRTIAWDVDGVFVDFNKGVKTLTGFESEQMRSDKSIRNKVWREINRRPYEFWSQLELIEDAMEMYDLTKHIDHFFLTGLPGDSVGLGKKGKEDRLQELFPVTLEQIKVVKRKDKALFAESHILLIDDTKENCEWWIEAGGQAIFHKTVEDTKKQLKILLGV